MDNGIAADDRALSVSVPHLIEELKGIPIRDVAAGRGHSMFLVGDIPEENKPYPFPQNAFSDATVVCQD